MLNMSSIFSSPFLSAPETFALFMRDIEATFHGVDDAFANEFAELLPPEA
jgi:hypothetical protein